MMMGTSATEQLVLSQQVQLVAGGDGLFPHCDLADDAPEAFRQDPGVWLHELFSPTEYPMVVNLCLRGFSADQPIRVSVTTGGFAATSIVEPVDGPPPEPVGLGYEDAPGDGTVRRAGRLPVYTRSYDGGPFEGPPDTMASQMWTFVPPSAAREALASAEEMSVTATQGSTTATEVHPIAVPATRASFSVDTSDGQALVVHGYPEGRLPVGLYVRDESYESGTLVREAGSVDVPASRVATWPGLPTCSTASTRGTTACCRPSSPRRTAIHPRVAALSGRGCRGRQRRGRQSMARDPHRGGRDE